MTRAAALLCIIGFAALAPAGSALAHRHHHAWPRVTYRTSYGRPHEVDCDKLLGLWNIRDDSGERTRHGRLKRSRLAREAFQCRTPCPSTHGDQGPCPGYVVDHITPLKDGGADLPSNMQWQTLAEARAKDRVE
ncbi:HNH endonuclease signature motif containing protein [Phenylobacterium montanum]|uniref:HNH endonuclease n=1 Tax=Phenylobacterium montanum TaxID=2823693 RepID=A0A975IV22_9CAUL|nr:HNH endonuclease signature motif containing protein [Caulobacter sp. S6]QUD88398.1 HNH endonuclease [Caulobacter sp. S6]